MKHLSHTISYKHACGSSSACEIRATPAHVLKIICRNTLFLLQNLFIFRVNMYKC